MLTIVVLLSWTELLAVGLCFTLSFVYIDWIGVALASTTLIRCTEYISKSLAHICLPLLLLLLCAAITTLTYVVHGQRWPFTLTAGHDSV